MKVLIVTTQRHFNFGTLLQCHALQHYVESLDHDVEVLDYTHREYMLSRLSRLRIFLGGLRRYPVKYLRILSNALRIRGRNKLFVKFLKERVNLTDAQYGTYDTIKEKLPDYDIYIAGSDQIWNPRLGGFKPAYFLKFAPQKSLKISYAASFGIDSFNAAEAESIRPMTKNLDAISCREQTGVDFLKGAGIDSVLVADPTLLLSAKYWRSIADRSLSKKLPKKYVLSYFLSGSERKTGMIEKVFKDTSYNLLDLCADDNASSNSILVAGPEQFLALIDNCELLITDSFHGIVFAIIFHKNFYVVPRKYNDPDSQNTRVINLLEILGLMNRWQPTMTLPATNEYIDYTKVEPLLHKYVSTSTDWLNLWLKK